MESSPWNSPGEPCIRHPMRKPRPPQKRNYLIKVVSWNKSINCLPPGPSIRLCRLGAAQKQLGEEITGVWNLVHSWTKGRCVFFLSQRGHPLTAPSGGHVCSEKCLDAEGQCLMNRGPDCWVFYGLIDSVCLFVSRNSMLFAVLWSTVSLYLCIFAPIGANG